MTVTRLAPTPERASPLPLPILALLAIGIACSSEESVNPGPTPTAMAVVSGDNQSDTVNAVLAQPFVVQVRDAAGGPLPGVTVNWTVVAGGGTLGSSTSTTNASGQAQTSYALGPDPGTNTVRAAAQGTPLQVTFTATGSEPPANVTPAVLTILNGNNQSAKVGTGLPDSLMVEVRNALGAPLSGVAVTWAVTAGGGTLGVTSGTTGVTGRSGNTYTVGTTAGMNTITATVQGTPGLIATFTATATPDTVPTLIEIVSGNNQSATVNSALAAPLVVRVRNALSQTLQNVTVSWAIAGGGTLGAPTSTTNAQGQASNTYTTGGTARTDTVTAAVQGNAGLFVRFTITVNPLPNASAVSVQDNAFNPLNATLATGGTVTWTWTGSNPHNVTWVSGGLTNSGNKTSGTHQVTFGSAGVYSYYCSIHGSPGAGMRGSVTVQ